MPPKILEIIIDPDPRLREVSEPVTEFNEDLSQFIASMLHTMHENDGIGLAAPQVGLHKRLLVTGLPDKPSKYFINPEIIATKGSQKQQEGCLSIPNVYGYPKNKRYKAIRLKYQDISGDEYVQEFDGLEAVCIQHEIDHLDGKLFTDGGIV